MNACNESVDLVKSETVERRRPAHGWGWARWAWRTLTTMRTAVILLALLALAAVPGSFLPQRNVASDPAAVPRFYAEHPDLAPWLDRFSFFDVYASPWFAAVYMLLLISMMGCVLPRCRRLWHECRAIPVRAPSRLARFEHHHEFAVAGTANEALARGADLLRRRRYRVVATDSEVRAEKGYLREAGNLAFHLSLLVLLVGVALGKLFGFEGRAALAEGETFTNVMASYDAFTPSALTRVDELTSFDVTLDDLDAQFAMVGPRMGEPREFDARVTYTRADGSTSSTSIRPNEPLDIDGTKLFLSGHGYAPRVTVRDGDGEIAFAGPVIFLPMDGNFTSDGVVKAPNASPAQLGFEGVLFPTDPGNDGSRSQFPDLLAPRLDLTAYTGDLGMDTGMPQSVFTLELGGVDEVARQSLRIGETMDLPDGAGSITFDGVDRFANFQIAYDPGKEVSLVAAIMLMAGLTASLVIRRRRVWIRVSETSTGAVAELAGQSLTRRGSPAADFDELVRELSASTEPRARSIQ